MTYVAHHFHLEIKLVKKSTFFLYSYTQFIEKQNKYIQPPNKRNINTQFM